MQLDELNLCVEDNDGENKRLSRMPNSEDNHRSASINNKCKRKDKRMALSKIPVRQIKPSTLIGRRIEDGSKNTDCIIIADNENVEQIKQQTVVENDKIIVEIENELKCNVGKEIENESVVIEEKKPNGIQKLQLTSEQVKPKNMDSSNNVNETILEAPEPFRCKYPSIDQVDDVVDGKEPQLHDEENTFKPETGDTIQLAPTTTNNVKEVEVEVASLDPNVSITTNCSNCLQELCNNEDNDHITDGGNSLNMYDMMATTTTPATTMTMMVDDRKVCANLVIEASSQVDTSIESGVAQCAQTPGCSRISAANSFTTTSITDNEDNTNNPTSTTVLHDNKQEINRKPIENQLDDKLCWRFKNGRLVFETAERKSVLDDDGDEDDGGNGDVEQVVVDDNNSINCCATDEDISKDCDGVVDVLYSKDLNKPKSRLKSLEDKLKQAGITAYDTNQNVLVEDDLKRNQQELIINNDFCQFDVRQINENLTRFNNGFYCQVYDEKQENHLSSSSSECDSDDESICFINVPKLTSTMGTDGEKTIKHNPDRDNLKSLLKKPGKTKDKKSNRVVFNENKNEFFDADYIILIREECDYDDEDDDGVCTCNQHEMVRLQCCEPNCNCNLYEQGCYDQTPQSPKFAPPIEFVDAVTLSPPEGYKDMELGEEEFLALQQMRQRGQRQAVCRECSATHEDDDDDDDDGGDECHSDTENGVRHHQQMSDEHEEKEKTDQSQQTTPTTPPNDSDNPNYILETITMTTVTEHRIINETEDIERKIPSPSVGSPISGILKGGRLWKQQSLDVGNVKTAEQTTDASITSDEENNSRRSVRFIETESKRDSCDGAPDNPPDEVDSNKSKPHNDASNSPESTEMMLTFKLGNHVLISNNSLKPNSAVRQLFPCTKPLQLKQGDDPEQVHQYLVTAESLRAFEEAKRSKLPQIIQSGETDESIKRAIERNTLRRSLIRYEPRPKKPVKKTDNSLVERIKQLTCDVDNVDETARVSPPGEEARNSPEVHNNVINKNHDKSFSPSSSSTASSNSSSMSSTYRKITDLFGNKRGEKLPDVQNDTKIIQTLPDIGGPTTQNHHDLDVKLNPDSRRQFLAPLTACVSSMSMNTDEYYYHLSGNQIDGERASMASSVGTEYSLEDIDEGLKNGQDDENKMIAPDVLAGTPSASESGDELAMFVQQDASRIERIKKKYHSEKDSKDEDDEHDDYGFNHRPSVRGIKPRFGSTTEILQQIQNQLQPPQPGRVAWPYYSESGLSGTDNSKQRNMNQMPLNYQYSNVPEDVKRCFTQPQQQQPQPQYRPTSLQTDDNMYQNCSNQQRCVREVYRSNVNYSTAVVRGEYYQSLPRNQTVRTNNGRPQSPPPLEMSKTYHQTMVYIPYNHIEPIPPQTHPYYHQSNDYARVTNQNQINKRYIEPIYQQRIDPMLGKPVVPRPNGQQQHLLNCSRSESPLPGQFSTARSTQTPSATSCNYYPRYRPMVGPVNWNMDGNYVTKMNRHSFPAGIPRYPPADSVSLTDSESQMLLANGYQQQPQQQRQIEFGMQKDSMPNSPTKPRFIERGVPEGAASVSPQDTVQINQNSTMTSPTSPQNPQPPPPSSSSTATTTTKPLFYAMNV